MEPKRTQGPGHHRRQTTQSPMFKTGDYVPLALLVVDRDNRLKNVHLPQKLFAVKDFTQADMLMHYFFQHPQQPVMLDEHNPKVAEFNSAVTNLHQWLIKNGYCTQEGGTDIISRVWTQDEVQAARDELKARRDAQILAHAEAMAAAGEEGMDISQGINNLLGASDGLRQEGQKMYAEFEQAALEQDRPAVNVGTVGHVDHGVSGVAKALERVDIEVDLADPEPEVTRAFLETEVIAHRSVSDGGQAFEQSAASADEPEAFLIHERPTHELDVLLVDPAPVRTPQYPLPVTAAE